MSGKEMLQFGRVDDVNINGTCHVLEACVEHGVKRLVYVSTYNVVFGGRRMEISIHAQFVRLLSMDQGLQSTVLNSSAHYSRAWSMTCQSGSLAVSHALVLGRIFQLVYTILYPWLNRWWLPQPLRLPTEVHEVGVTHYFSFLKAKEELGYVPMVSPQEGMAATISYFQERKIRSLDGPTIYTWMFSVIGMTLLFIAAYWPAFGLVSLLRDFCLFFFRSMWVMRMVFILATAAHIGEAMYAWHLAKKVDPLNARGWFWQTLALGVLSLRFLLKRARK
ncbi:uncharacterized protein LOC114292704 isoform X2 [Camellia sinensis]|uniref:uncharacterized protein LOC114292704 isoform X2 n=1 Tax=Camellia sinensis TaxID=4442 RepID=UPI0010357005|nr:uncharacterized protein LOC114292704 isoform X2 [Camellia sinensis]